ncbi:PAS domain-containing protein [Streptomyces gamaensis]|uniref:PAS domain-containing protein n=1 Tax=Streptomyces gamaensis TaxID=1763542 RepID=A0ABW0YUM9_9ACTN
MSSRPSRGAARLAAILDALPDALLLVNCNGTVVNANHIALETFEVPGTALVGRGLLSLLPDFDSRRIPGSMRLPERDEGRTKPTRMTARRTDGTQFPVEVTSANLEDGRTPYADHHPYTGDELLMIVVRDLTGTLDTEAELARQQRQTEMILRAAAEGVVGVDTAGKVVLVNPSAAQILGYRASDLGGQELHPLIHHSRADGTPFPYEDSPIADTLRSGRKHRVRQQVLWAKDGRAVPVDLTTAPVRDGDQLVGAVMTFTDRRPYDALAARHAQLVALLHSSLRGPLEELRAELGTLADDPAGQLWPEANQILRHLTAGYARMTTLVDNVLAYQRLDSGEIKPDRAKAALDAVVAAGVEGATELIGPGRAQFAVHAPKIEAEIDAGLLAQALAHLIADVAGVDATGNASAQGPAPGDSTIVVAAAQRGEVVRVEVRGPYPGGDPVHGPVVRGIVRAHGGVLQTHELPGAAGGRAYVLEVPVSAKGGPVAGGERRPATDPMNATTVMPVPAQRARGTGAGAGKPAAPSTSPSSSSSSADGAKGGAGAQAPGSGRRARRDGEEAPARTSEGDEGAPVPAPTGRRRARPCAEEEQQLAADGRHGRAVVPPQGTAAPTARRARREAAAPEGERTAFALPPAEADRAPGGETAAVPAGRRARRAATETPERPAAGRAGAEQTTQRTAFALPPAQADRRPGSENTPSAPLPGRPRGPIDDGPPAVDPATAAAARTAAQAQVTAFALPPGGGDGPYGARPEARPAQGAPFGPGAPEPEPGRPAPVPYAGPDAPRGPRAGASGGSPDTPAEPYGGARQQAADAARTAGPDAGQGSRERGPAPVTYPGAPRDGREGETPQGTVVPGPHPGAAQPYGGPRPDAPGTSQDRLLPLHGGPVPGTYPAAVAAPPNRAPLPGAPGAQRQLGHAQGGRPNPSAVPQSAGQDRTPLPGVPAPYPGIPGTQPQPNPSAIPATAPFPDAPGAQRQPDHAQRAQPNPSAAPAAGPYADAPGAQRQPDHAQGAQPNPSTVLTAGPYPDASGAQQQPERAPEPQGMSPDRAPLPGAPAPYPGNPGTHPQPNHAPESQPNPSTVLTAGPYPDASGAQRQPGHAPGQHPNPQSAPAADPFPDAPGAQRQPDHAQRAQPNPSTAPATGPYADGPGARRQPGHAPEQHPNPQSAPAADPYADAPGAQPQPGQASGAHLQQPQGAGSDRTPQPGAPAPYAGTPGAHPQPDRAPGADPHGPASTAPGPYPGVPGAQPQPDRAPGADPQPGRAPGDRPDPQSAGQVSGAPGAQPQPGRAPEAHPNPQSAGQDHPSPHGGPGAPGPYPAVPSSPEAPAPGAHPLPGAPGMAAAAATRTAGYAPAPEGAPQADAAVPAPTGRRRARRALAEEPGAAARPGGEDPHRAVRPISVRALGQSAPFGQPDGQTPSGGTPTPGSGRRRKLANPAEGEREARTEAPPAPRTPPRPAPEGRAFAVGAPDDGSEGPEPLDGPGGAVEVVAAPHPPAGPMPLDDELPPEPVDNPRRLLVWPAPDASTEKALTERGYRPVIVHSREEVEAQRAAYPAALFIDPLTGPITRTALQSLREAAVTAGVPVLVTAGLGQATREAAYGADPAVLLKALAPRDSEMHPPRVLLLEEHAPIADALTAALEQRGMQVACAADDADAVALAERVRPNLVVMDLMQVRRRRSGLVDRLAEGGLLGRVPLVVYTSAAIDPAQLPALAAGETVLFLAERSTSAEVQSRIVDLLARIGTG